MKKFLRTAILLLLCAVLLATGVSAADYVPPFDLSAQAVYLINLDSERVIYEKNATERIEPSALAQLMTVILALEKADDPANEILAMKPYIEDEMYRKNIALGGIRLAGLYRNEEISLQSLLYAVMLRDANEASMIIADYFGDGSIPYFVEMMNERAAELGATDTNFTNPTGLPDAKSYTTARDICILARHAMSLPGFLDLIAVTTYDGGPTSRQEHLYWHANNKLMQSGSEFYNPAVEGIKVGYHNDLGSFAVTQAKKDGYTYLAVLMGCTSVDSEGQDTSYNQAFVETSRLYGWAFDTFRVKTLLEKGKSFGEVPLRLCWGKDFLRIMSADNFTALIPDEIEASSIRHELVLPSYLEAPIEKGEMVGEVRLVLAGEQIGRVGVVSAETVEVSRTLLMLDKLIGVTETFWFKFIVVFLVTLILLYIALMVVRNRNKRRYHRGRRRR